MVLKRDESRKTALQPSWGPWYWKAYFL